MTNPDRLTGLDSSFLHLERDAAHMHVAACMVFKGHAPTYDELLGQSYSRLHLVPRYRQRLAFVPLSQGRPVWVDDPHFNLALSTSATPRCRSPGGEAELKRLGRPGVLPGARSQPAAVGAVAGRGTGRATASRCSQRPITRSSTASQESTSARCCSTPRRIRCRLRRPSTNGSRGRCRARRSCWPTRCSSAPPLRPRSSAASGPRCAVPRRVARKAGESLVGVGALAWVGAAGRARRARSTSRSGRTAGSPGCTATWRSSRRSRTHSAGPSTTSCWPSSRARWAATCDGRGHATDDLVLKAMVPVSVRSRRRARRARQPRGRDVGAAAGRDDRPGRSGCYTISEAMDGIKESGQAVGAQVLTEPDRALRRPRSWPRRLGSRLASDCSTWS